MNIEVGQTVEYQTSNRTETAEVIQVTEGRVRLQLVNKLGEIIRKYVTLRRIIRVVC